MRRLQLLLSALAALPLVASPATPSRVYPTEPRTLRRLIAEAPYIVKATVIAPDSPSPGRSFKTNNPRRIVLEDVVLVIEEVVKGKLDEKEIPISTNFNVTCPAQPRYALGTHVLAFLDWTKERGYSNHALTYGAKELDDASMKTYLERVKEEFAILAINNESARRKAQVEWLVKCCENSATRWEGAFDLAPRGDPMSSYFESSTPGSTDGDGDVRSSETRCKLDEGFSRELSDAQRKRLRDAWYSSKQFRVGEMCLDELFLPERDPKALEWLVARLRDRLKLEVREEEDDNGAAYLLDRIVRRDDRPAVVELAKEYSRTFSFATLDVALLAQHKKVIEDVLALY
jgi:hypothetical protein